MRAPTLECSLRCRASSSSVETNAFPINSLRLFHFPPTRVAFSFPFHLNTRENSENGKSFASIITYNFSNRSGSGYKLNNN